MTYPKRKNSFRLYCQNINGLKLDEKGGDLHAINEFLNKYQCDAVGFSEINLDVSKYKVQQILTDSLNKSFEANRFSTSTSDIPFETFYKPGGTMTAVFNDVVSRCNGKYSDPMGRWSTISLTGKRGRLIHLVTVYQVVDNANTGPFTAYQQQASSLRLAERTLNPRQAFIADLASYLRKLQSAEAEFIVMGRIRFSKNCS